MDLWLAAGKPAWLCTILKTWGSSPRPVGAMMACTLDGELVGSISGGCIEEDFLEQLQTGSLKKQFDECADSIKDFQHKLQHFNFALLREEQENSKQMSILDFFNH